MLANYTKVPLDVTRRPAAHDAHQSESKSIECLKKLVVRSAEVFNLWKLLSEHQFYIIANKLIDVRKLEKLTYFCYFFKNIIFYIKTLYFNYT